MYYKEMLLTWEIYDKRILERLKSSFLRNLVKKQIGGRIDVGFFKKVVYWYISCVALNVRSRVVFKVWLRPVRAICLDGVKTISKAKVYRFGIWRSLAANKDV